MDQVTLFQEYRLQASDEKHLKDETINLKLLFGTSFLTTEKTDLWNNFTAGHSLATSITVNLVDKCIG